MSAGGVRIFWRASSDLSAAHAARVVASGAKCIDRQTETLLVDLVAKINTRLIHDSIDIAEFWRGYVAEIASGQQTRKACVTALAIAGCNELQLESTSTAVTKKLAEAKSVFQGRFPKLQDQLTLRGRPLRDRWDSLGPGCLRQIERLIWQSSAPGDWWPPRVTGFLVQPMRGGDGHWDGPEEHFWVEAMLSDVDPGVPEVLRVAWLVCGIAIENHCRLRSSETDLMSAWKLASVPITLAAGSELELVSASSLPIDRAMSLWHVAPDEVADVVARWWRNWRGSQTPLPIALGQLSRQLDEC